MKVTIDIDCTPAEAREFLGLPNIQPMQEKAIKAVEEKLLSQRCQHVPRRNPAQLDVVQSRTDRRHVQDVRRIGRQRQEVSRGLLAGSNYSETA